MMGGSLLCCSNFLMNLSPKLFCCVRKEAVVTTSSPSSLFSACLLSLYFYHQIITNFHKATLSDEGNQSPVPWLSSVSQQQFIPLGLRCGVFPLFNLGCPKSHLPSPQPQQPTYCWDIHHNKLCCFISAHVTAPQPAQPQWWSAPAAPAREWEGPARCWSTTLSPSVVSLLLAQCTLAAWSPALLTALPIYNQKFYFGFLHAWFAPLLLCQPVSDHSPKFQIACCRLNFPPIYMSLRSKSVA